MNSNPQKSPLEKLLIEKQRIETACKEKEEKLNETFSYMQANAGTLLLSAFSSVLFPTKKKSKEEDKKEGGKSINFSEETSKMQLSDYFSIGKSLLPIAWEVVQPIMVGWGIKLIRKKLTRLLFHEDKAKV